MKEMKFRAVISPKTTIIYFTLEDLVNPKPLFGIRELLIPWLRAGNKPDEYTGVKDKNGREIYEGDIVTFKDFKDVMTAEVEWWETGQWGYKPKGWIIGYPAHTVGGNLKVIGNIYENPELLEVKQ